MPILRAKSRDIFGKKVKQLRDQGMMPAVLYGAGKKTSQPLSLLRGDFERVLRDAGESTLIDLEVEGVGTKNVLIHDIDMDPVKEVPRHADFYEVDMTKSIRTKIPITFIGESEAVKSGGILVKVLHAIEIEALPKDLPKELSVDISQLKVFEDRVLLRDITLPAGVTMIIDDADAVVALVESPRTEEEMEALKEKPSEVALEGIELAGKKKEEPEEIQGTPEAGAGAKTPKAEDTKAREKK